MLTLSLVFWSPTPTHIFLIRTVMLEEKKIHKTLKTFPFWATVDIKISRLEGAPRTNHIWRCSTQTSVWLSVCPYHLVPLLPLCLNLLPVVAWGRSCPVAPEAVASCPPPAHPASPPDVLCCTGKTVFVLLRTQSWTLSLLIATQF